MKRPLLTILLFLLLGLLANVAVAVDGLAIVLGLIRTSTYRHEDAVRPTAAFLLPLSHAYSGLTPAVGIFR